MRFVGVRGRLSFDGGSTGCELGPARGGGEGVARRAGGEIASGDRVDGRLAVKTLGVVSVVDTVDTSVEIDISLDMSAA